MTDNVKEFNRIVYVEPNDFEKINGEPLTPDYTDYTIYCNLIVERVSRLKHGNGGKNQSGDASIMYDLNDGKQGWVSFFQGESKEYNYLSTSYTDIHFNSIEKHNIVEGLQVESIDISYVNRFVPTVVINMVDIRGGGLFGREEAIHPNGNISNSNMEKDSDGNAIDNIYSGFMTFPYPRYKLHVKGFYGKDVVYQLTCSKFNARFDSNTGNFNITCEFIGYEYGFLADLPFQYILAAPYTKVGREYWKKHVNSKEWQIDNGGVIEKPVLLIDFFKKIKSASVDNISDDEINEYLELSTNWNDVVKEWTSKSSLLNKIKDGYKELIAALKESNKDTNVIDITDTLNKRENRDVKIFLLNDSGNIRVNERLSNAYNNLYQSLNNYKDVYNYNEQINTSIISLNGTEFNMGEYEGCLTETFTYDTENNLVFNSDNINTNNYVVSTSTLQNHTFNLLSKDKESNYELMYKLSIGLNENEADQLYEKLTGLENNSTNKVPKYCGCIYLKGWGIIDDVIEEYRKKYDEYKKKINNGDLIKITNLLGMSPYIYSYFKTVFCHIETFIHTLTNCVNGIYDDINGEKRDPKLLGIYTDYTDVPTELIKSGNNGPTVPPFPGCYKNYVDGYNSNYNGDILPISKLSWVGDFKGVTDWKEEALVNEYFKAVQLIIKDDFNGFESLDDENVLCGLFPFFIKDNTNKKIFLDKDGLTFYVSIMAYYMLGILNKNDIDNQHAKVLGAVLAQHLYDSCDNITELKKGVQGNLSSIISSKSKKLLSSLGRTKFEFAKVIDGRQPIFSEKDGRLEYVYMRDNENQPIIPLDEIDNFNNLSTKYTFNNGAENNKNRFEPKHVDDGDYIIGGNKGVIETNENYMNSKMFSVLLDSCNVKDLEINYENLKDSAKIGDIKNADVQKYIFDKYWLMEDNYNKYKNTNTKSKTLNYDDKVTSDNFTLNDKELNELLKCQM